MTLDPAALDMSRALDQVSRAVAEWTVDRHASQDEDLLARYGPGSRRRWVADVHVRVRYLSQAIAIQCPELFAAAVAWSTQAYMARAVEPADLETSLTCMIQVLETELPAVIGEHAAGYVRSGVTRAAAAEPLPPTSIGLDKPHGELVIRYLDSLLRGERREAEQLVMAADRDGVPFRDLYLDVLRPAQIEIGRMWHLDEISVADEHFATATTKSIMSVLRSRTLDGAVNGRRVVATSIEGELHDLGVRMVADFFELNGWRVSYLGANMPNADIVRCLAEHDAHVLAASVTSFLNIRALAELIQAIRAESGSGGVRIVVGGLPCRAVPDLWQRLGADGSAGDAEEAVETANRLVGI